MIATTRTPLTGTVHGTGRSGWASRWRQATADIRWRTLQRRFDQRAERERLLMIGAVLALTLVLADRLWLSPALAAFKQARTQQATARTAMLTLQADTQTLKNLDNTQARQQQADLATWRQRVRDGDIALRRHEQTLVGSDRMVGLLEQLLAHQGQVRVRAMRSLGRADLLNPGTPGVPALPDKAVGAVPAAAAAAPDAAAPSLYRHGVELVLEGGFADLLQYLRAVEALPQRVLWGSISLKVEQHPKSVLTLRVYTISRDRHWLEI